MRLTETQRCTIVEQRARHLIHLLKDVPSLTLPGENGPDLCGAAVHDAFFATPAATVRLQRVVREVLWPSQDMVELILRRALVLRREDTTLDDDRATRMSGQLLWLIGRVCDPVALARVPPALMASRPVEPTHMIG
jgi:hypothetical protein